MIFQKKILAITSVLILILLASCDVLPDDNPPVETPALAMPTNVEDPTAEVNQDWVIFSQEQAEEMGLGSWLVEGDGFWTPSPEDIFQLEGRLVGYLRQNEAFFWRQPPVWERLDEYQSQYIGFVRNGKHMIYGNFFCDNFGWDWQEKLVMVEDGGDCYFQVEYDVEDEALIMLMVNGDA